MILFTTNKDRDGNLPDDWKELTVDFRHWLIGFNWSATDKFGYTFWAVHFLCFSFIRSVKK